MKIEKDNVELFNIPENKILILLIPYSYNPEKSFNRACNIVFWLRNEYPNPVFSPILHTHNYDIFCKKNNLDNNENYYSWDIKIYSHLKENSIIIFTKDWEKSKGCKLEMEWVKKNNLPYIFIDENT